MTCLNVIYRFILGVPDLSDKTLTSVTYPISSFSPRREIWFVLWCFSQWNGPRSFYLYFQTVSFKGETFLGSRRFYPGLPFNPYKVPLEKQESGKSSLSQQNGGLCKHAVTYQHSGNFQTKLYNNYARQLSKHGTPFARWNGLVRPPVVRRNVQRLLCRWSKIFALKLCLLWALSRACYSALLYLLAILKAVPLNFWIVLVKLGLLLQAHCKLMQSTWMHGCG